MMEEARNEDLLDISSSLKSHVNVKYDLKSLLKSEFVYDIDPELTDVTLSHDEYLDAFRRRAESKIIKMKIIYKLHNSEELSANEKQYMKRWVSDIKSGRNLLNLRDSMVPSTASKLTL